MHYWLDLQGWSFLLQLYRPGLSLITWYIKFKRVLFSVPLFFWFKTPFFIWVSNMSKHAYPISEFLYMWAVRTGGLLTILEISLEKSRKWVLWVFSSFSDQYPPSSKTYSKIKFKKKELPGLPYFPTFKNNVYNLFRNCHVFDVIVLCLYKVKDYKRLGKILVCNSYFLQNWHFSQCLKYNLNTFDFISTLIS